MVSSSDLKVIGLLGGMSWESSAEYYRILNREVRSRLGGQHSAELLLYSFDFDEMQRLQHAGRWDVAAARLVEVAKRLEDAGAELLVLCTNTMHRVAAELERESRIPLVHIVDAVAGEIRRAGLSTIGLLGTRFTMEQAFYRDRLSSHELSVKIPEEAARSLIHDVIYQELCQGRILDGSRHRLRR